MHYNARGDLNQSAVYTRNVEAFLKRTAIAYQQKGHYWLDLGGSSICSKRNRWEITMQAYRCISRCPLEGFGS